MNEDELYNVVIMIMKHIRPDGQFSYFSYSEINYIYDLLHKIKAEGENKKMKCPQCPYYEQKTSYGKEKIKCHNKNCTDCILDLTDACSRGAGRAVDDEICEDFLEADKENKE